MQAKIPTLAVAAALIVGAGAGYVAGDATNGSATARPPADESVSPGHSMMSGRDGSMMADMMGARHEEMMRVPGMRTMHRAMVREHAEMMRRPTLRRQHERAMREFPEMARMMRDHMGR